jgi:putative membrane protein
MIGFIIRFFANVLSLFAVATFVPGINVDNSRSLVLAVLALGLVNAVLRPVILLFTLPFNILSLGLLTLFINGLLFYGVSKIVKGFYVSGFWSAFWGAIVFSIISFFLNLLINPQGNKFKVRYQSKGRAGSRRKGEVIDVEACHEKKPGQRE